MGGYELRACEQERKEQLSTSEIEVSTFSSPIRQEILVLNLCSACRG